MMWAGPTTATKRAKASHEPWTPHAYQRKAVRFLIERGAAALFLDPGLGKTSIVLTAFQWLQSQGVASRMLVVAPLRVCQTVWRQEGQKWTEFRDLRFSLLHGPKKLDRLKDEADIWLINPEGVAWLCDQYRGRPLPFDTVVIDELTKFKNHAAERHKALRPRLRGAARRWGLTGTPAPNGLMDLFGQFLLLDDGAALGRFVTHFRDQYFQVGFNGFDYELLPGAEKRIEAKIAPYVLRMSAEDYLELPPLVDDIIELELDPKSRATYAKMKKDMLAELPEGVVTGANAAACYSKLKQMANGAVYVNDAGDVAQIHNTKIEALDEIREELAGQQLLLAYEFNHDLQRLKAHYGDKCAYLESGLSEAKNAALVAAWNRGELTMLACHPQSAAHGLNLQQASCAHVCWFSPIWDLELYQQFIGRIRRQGNEAQRIVNHILCVKDSIDELALAALRDKDTTQSRLLASLKQELTGEKETDTMSVAKLSRPFGQAGTVAPAAATQAAAPPARIVPKGWGVPKQDTAPVQEQPAAVQDIEAQRERIAAKLTGQPVAEHHGLVDTGGMNSEGPNMAEKARSAFSGGIRAALEGDSTQLETIQHLGDAGHTAAVNAQEATDAKPTRRRRTQAEIQAAAVPEPAIHVTEPSEWERVEYLTLRWSVLSKALDNCEDVSSAVETAKELWAFVTAEAA